ncbi:MAG TPA: TetR family transcriptional regulator [Streptosporangiaceae bacterium]|jgi:AcrR family transcriptional regulator
MISTGAAAQPGAARPLRADAQRNYQRLIDAATATFTEQSADDASLEEIARRAGVGIGTLYRHFPNRQALLEAVYSDQVSQLRRRADELAGADDPVAALAEWLGAVITFGRTKRSLVTALLANLDKGSELLSACSTVLREAAGVVLRRAQQAGAVRPDTDCKDLLRLVHGISMAVEREPADSGQAQRLLALVLDGLRHQPG